MSKLAIQIDPPKRVNVKKRLTRKPHMRNGLVLLETVVAAVLVLAMLSVAAPIVIRSARIWKQTRHYQFAGDELSGQMDRLIAMPTDARTKALEELSVSPEIHDVLHRATLDGKLVADADGKRIELSINWERIGDPTPITLVAWIDPLSDRSTDSTSTDQDGGKENNQ